MKFSELFTDKMNKVMYYDKAENAYYFVKASEVRKTSVYLNRFFVSLAAAALMPTLFHFPWWTAIIVFIGIFGFIEWIFRKYVKPKLTLNPKYNPQNMKDSPKHSFGFIVFKTIAYIVLGSLIFLLIYLEPRDSVNNMLMILFGLLSFGLAFRSMIEWMNIHQQKEETR